MDGVSFFPVMIIDGVSFFPARIIDICRPLLNAWLKSRRVWNSDTKGNHDRMAVGMKIMSPMMYSYALASSFIDSQNPMPFIIGLQACPIFGKRGKRESILDLELNFHYKKQYTNSVSNQTDII